MGDKIKHPMPQQRTEDLIVRACGEETLVLDRRTGTLHCLPAEVSRVWGACTGQNTLAEVTSAAAVDEPVAAGAVAQLMELDLLEAPAGIDRRTLLRRGALASAGVAAAPVIQSVVAPPPALACTTTGSIEFLTPINCYQGGNYDIPNGAIATSPLFVNGVHYVIRIYPAGGPYTPPGVSNYQGGTAVGTTVNVPTEITLSNQPTPTAPITIEIFPDYGWVGPTPPPTVWICTYYLSCTAEFDYPAPPR